MSAPRPAAFAFGLLAVLAVLIGPLYALLAPLDAAIGASLATSAATAALWLVVRLRGGRVPRLLLAVALGVGIGVHYGATGSVIRTLGRPSADASLAAADARLLSGVLPHGEVAVAVDRSPVVGPETPLGRGLAEVLQLAYVSYYAWGAGLLFLLLSRAWRGVVGWATVEAYLVAWVGTYLVNYGLYCLVPAVGPWQAFPGWFAHPVRGYVATGALRSFVADHQVTPDCFPSGHTALSWVVAITALRLAPRYGRVATVAACAITVATLWLRYHYAADLLAAVPLALLGLAWGGFLVPSRAKQPRDPRFSSR